MTREERDNSLHCLKVMVEEANCEDCNLYGTTGTDHCERDCVKNAIQVLEQEARKDEVILTNKEYRELLSSEFYNGYEKGFREALEQEPCTLEVLELEPTPDMIRSEITRIQTHKMFEGEDTVYIERDDVLAIIDKYRAEESEEEE